MRPEDWPQKLALFEEEKRNQRFRWGENDCCLLAADWVAMVLGQDPAQELRGHYHTALGAARIFRQTGGLEALVDAIAAKAGLPSIDPRLASRGDVVSFDSLRGFAIGVCLGVKAMFAGPAGAVFVPMDKCRRAWKVS